jgi:uncharacterized protein YjbI with pentapeptide repeats
MKLDIQESKATSVSKTAVQPVSVPQVQQAQQQSATPAKGPEPQQQNELPADTGSVTLSLIELAEILDQHRIWVETNGESGTKADLTGVNLSKADLTGVNLQEAHLHRANLSGADLSMANLRGASLVQADLRDTNLLGAELRGVNFMGATLYGAEGLWVGRLGGTNLFDALLPETVASFDSSKAIADATKVARWFYFLALSVCVVCCLLIAFTSDIRLLLNASALPIPHTGNLLPMTGFYLGGPILLFILYLRFHFLLLRLWGSMAALPAVFPDGQTLEKDGPWYLMGLARWHFRWQRDHRSPFSALETALATVLAYWVVPATLFLFWLRYLVRQDFRGTLLHVVLLTIAAAAATALPVVVSNVLKPGEIRIPKSKNVLRVVLATTRAALIAGVVLFIFSLGVNHGLPADASIAPEHSPADPRRWAAQVFQSVGYRPFADLTEASLSTTPRGGWTDESLAAVPGAHLNLVNLRFVRAYRTFLANARLWRADLEGAYLSEANLHGANMREAILKSAILDRVQAAGSMMVSANATGANFSSADLRGADMSYGIFENAILSNAKMAGASLYAVNLRNAQLLRTDLSRSDLRDAKLEHAIMSFTNLQEADLSSAKLTEASMTGAHLKGTILLDTDLKRADLRGAYLTGAILRGAEIDGVNLAGADLRGAIGIAPTQLCTTINWRAAQLDPDLLAQAQLACGGNAH